LGTLEEKALGQKVHGRQGTLMSAFTMEEAVAKIGKRVRRIADIAGVTSIPVGTVIRADAVDDGYIVGMVWDPAERLFGDPFSKDDEKLLTDMT
jgi:hypothetical protein